MARPRDTRIDALLLDAWRALATDSSYDDITMEAVAERAGVGKPSLYRRYPSKAKLAFAASVDDSVAPPEVDTGSLRGDLLAHVTALAASLEQGARAAFADQIATAITEPEFAVELARYDAAPLAVVLASWRRAVERGEVPSGTDGREVLNDLAGTLIFHVLVRHRTADAAYLTALVDRFLDGVRPR